MSSDVPFSFSPESLERARVILARYPEGRQASGVIPLLDLAQRQNDGWLSRPAMDAVAEFLEMAPIRVYEVATFYTMFNLQPVGEHHVQVCTNLPCWLRGSDQVVEGCRKSLGIDIGETTADGKFTLSEVECAGACVNAPVAQIGDHYYEDLDADGIATVLEALKRGETPSHGSQTGRQTSAPAGGPTTLKTATGEA
ncbi:MAG: NADH-quinone oxidoreductase subunit NuoE [Alphaproteobacteria bacterium]|jgi:NADH-quinone oxidoreductase subunit E|nr:NADH-quinone oxidoreductase subunit NuoE [Rhodospirillaceae bacterium]MDP6620819.1 NADH-quinone oxidoreductase subunit NuoE [Alphaproteobacteria bacterium]MDP7602412.1 NADH-quinone oxidoreductase subunit NuoE [Alphaproteobacteria bacterium]HJP21543.1 NADH-quinone oxidoreductase subunit NuoE [Alphaproteobacteria bacterium]|tara:strand:+ start:42 stop:632 length:591 start_codon:yes stop_codon:yes gene_type:complete